MSNRSNDASGNEQPVKLAVIQGSRRTLDLPTHILRRTASKLDFEVVTLPQRRHLARGMLAALHAGPGGVGIAAPMLGVALRVVVSIAGETPLALFNPEIVATEGPDTTQEEGNLCLPGVRASVIRPSSVTVRWQSLNSGQAQTRTFKSWEARVLMHEMEILDGKLFIDHASARPLGVWRDTQERAARGLAAIYSEGPPAAPGNKDPLALVTAPPSLLSLDGVLRGRARDVDMDALEPAHLRNLIESMLRVQYGARGVGLAAPQVGLGLRLIVIDSGEQPPFALINPTIVDMAEEAVDALEGCLSIPGWRGAVTRSTALKVRTDTVDRESIELEVSGHLARVVQHETDHLDGILYTDRMKPEAQLIATDAQSVAADEFAALARSEAVASRSVAKGTRPPVRKAKGTRHR